MGGAQETPLRESFAERALGSAASQGSGAEWTAVGAVGPTDRGRSQKFRPLACRKQMKTGQSLVNHRLAHRTYVG